MRRLFPLVSALLALTGPSAASLWASPSGPAFGMEILVDGRPVQQYYARNALYVEALKGREYAIRLHNPLDVRVAVALSVDGLNTIDARHTTATDARKWVLNPHETITIAGWQTDMNHARRFFFTSEQDSYAQWLGQTQNMGVISAVFFRERRGVRIEPIVVPPAERSRGDAQAAPSGGSAGAAKDAARAQSAPQPPGLQVNAMARVPEEYAATGIGDRTDHAVRRIHMDLEDQPAGTLNVRYEYRAQLVRLGVLPPAPTTADPLNRREGARGFQPGFCPEPTIRRW